MADAKKRESMDDSMLALRERLRQVSENLRKSRQASSEALNDTALQQSPPGGHNIVSPPPKVNNDDYIPARLPVDRWPDFLGKLSLRLEAVAGGTEERFLAMGAELYEFRRAAKNISETAGHVASLITDEQVGSNIDELKRIISWMKNWLTPPGQDMGPCKEPLNTRMLVDKTGVCLNTLEKKYVSSGFMVKDFNNKTQEIADSISSVIESLQYSDITRQRVARIKDSVDGLEKRLSDAGIGGTVTEMDGVKELAGEAGGACVRLSLDLRRTMAEFDEAVMAVCENLSAVSRDTGRISADIMRAVKGDSESGKSFMSAMGNWLGTLTDTLSALNDAGRTGGEVLSDINEMRVECEAVESTGAGGSTEVDEFGRMAGKLGGIVESLRKINGNILYRLSLIEDDSKALSCDIAEAVDRFGSSSRGSNMGDGVASGLDKIAEEARAIAPEAVARYATLRGVPGHVAIRPSDGSQDEEMRAGRSEYMTEPGHGAQDDNVELF